MLTQRQQLAHLYRRAGFGGKPDELAAASSNSLDSAVSDLLNFQSYADTIPIVSLSEPSDNHFQFNVGIGQSGEQTMTNLPVLTHEEFRGMTMEERQSHRRDERRHIEVQKVSWLNRMAATQRPLQEKLALFWHGHFATSFRKVQDATLMERQIETFRQYGLGNFESLVQAVSKDPAMILWLDNQSNNKQHPNENYARELMELFTLGIGHYTETDVREGARAFTGWKQDGGEFTFRKGQHDFGSKTFLGQTGNFDGEDVVRIVSKNPASAAFVARKLFVFFGYDNPEPRVVQELADGFARSGYNVKNLVEAILKSKAFRSERAYRAKVKGPVEFVVSAVRLLDGTIQDPNTLNLLSRMGQILYEPPSVKGWDGGAAWVSTSSLFDRFNFATYLVNARNGPLMGGDDLWDRAEAKGAHTVELLVDFYSDLLLQDQLPEKSRWAVITHTLGNVKGRINQAREVVRMILCSPEFQMA